MRERRPITEIRPEEHELFGPCKFEPDDRKIENNLCVIRSGNPALNATCGDCPSQYRVCRNCTRPPIRLVRKPVDGSGLCAECQKATEAPTPPDDVSEERIVQAIHSGALVAPGTSKESPVPPSERPRKLVRQEGTIFGEKLAKLIDDYRFFTEGKRRKTEDTAKWLKISRPVVSQIAVCAAARKELLALIVPYGLTVRAVVALKKFPPESWEPLARAIAEGRVTLRALDESSGKKVAQRSLLERHGIVSRPG